MKARTNSHEAGVLRKEIRGRCKINDRNSPVAKRKN